MKSPMITKKRVRWDNYILDSYLGNGSDVCSMPLEVSRAMMDDDLGPIRGY